MNAVLSEDNTSLYRADMNFASFLRQSGRLVVMPIWSHTFERNDGSTHRRFLGGPIRFLRPRRSATNR